MRAIIQRQASLTLKYLLCAQLVRFLQKLARHMLNKAAFDKQRATSWLALANVCQLSVASGLMQAVQRDLCLLQSIVQSHAEETSKGKVTLAGIVCRKVPG